MPIYYINPNIYLTHLVRGGAPDTAFEIGKELYLTLFDSKGLNTGQGVICKELGLLSSRCPGQWALEPKGPLCIESLKHGQYLVDNGDLSIDRYKLWLHKSVPMYVPPRMVELRQVYWGELFDIVKSKYNSLEMPIVQNSPSPGALWLEGYDGTEGVRISKVCGQHHPEWPANFHYGECSNWAPTDWDSLLPKAASLSRMARALWRIVNDKTRHRQLSKSQLEKLVTEINKVVIFTSESAKNRQMNNNMLDYLTTLFMGVSGWDRISQLHTLAILANVGMGTSYDSLMGLLTWALATDYFMLHWQALRKLGVVRLRRDIQVKVLKLYETAVSQSGHTFLNNNYIPLSKDSILAVKGINLICGRDWSQPLQVELEKRCVARRPIVGTNPETGEKDEVMAFAVMMCSLAVSARQIGLHKKWREQDTYYDFIKDRAENMAKGAQSDVKLGDYSGESVPKLVMPINFSVQRVATGLETLIQDKTVKVIWVSQVGDSPMVLELCNQLNINYLSEEELSLVKLDKWMCVINQNRPSLKVGCSLSYVGSILTRSELKEVRNAWFNYIHACVLTTLKSEGKKVRINKKAAAEELTIDDFMYQRDNVVPRSIVSHSDKNEPGKLKGRMILGLDLFTFSVCAHASEIYQEVLEEVLSDSVDSTDPVRAFQCHYQLSTIICTLPFLVYACIDWSDFNIHHTLEFMALCYIVRAMNVGAGNFKSAEAYEDWRRSCFWVANSIYNSNIKEVKGDEVIFHRIKTGLCSGERDTFLRNQEGQTALMRLAAKEVQTCLGYTINPSLIDKKKGDDYIAVVKLLDAILLLAGCVSINGDLRADGQYISNDLGEFLRIIHSVDGLSGQLCRALGTANVKAYQTKEVLGVYERAEDITSMLNTTYRRGRSIESCFLCWDVWASYGLKLKDSTVQGKTWGKLHNAILYASRKQGGWEVGVGPSTPLQMPRHLGAATTSNSVMAASAMVTKAHATNDQLSKYHHVLVNRIGVDFAAGVLNSIKQSKLASVFEHTLSPGGVDELISESSHALAEWSGRISRGGPTSPLINKWFNRDASNLFTWQGEIRRVVIAPELSGKTQFINRRDPSCAAGSLSGNRVNKLQQNGLPTVLNGLYDADQLIGAYKGWPEQGSNGEPWWEQEQWAGHHSNLLEWLFVGLASTKGRFIILTNLPLDMLDRLGRILTRYKHLTFHFVDVPLSMLEANSKLATVLGLRSTQPNNAVAAYRSNQQKLDWARRHNLPTFNSIRDAVYWKELVIGSVRTELSFYVITVIEEVQRVIVKLCTSGDHEYNMTDSIVSRVRRICLTLKLGSWSEILRATEKITGVRNLGNVFDIIEDVLSAADKQDDVEVMRQARASFGENNLEDILTYDVKHSRLLQSAMSAELGAILSSMTENLIDHGYSSVRDIRFSEYATEVLAAVEDGLYNVLVSDSRVMRWTRY